MAQQFPSFPPCCQELLRQLESQCKMGSRNCAKGHAVNLRMAYIHEQQKRQEAAARK